MDTILFDDQESDSPRVLIVGSSALTRAGVRTLLVERGATVVGAGSALDLFDAALPQTDVIVLLNAAPLPTILDSSPHTAILLLSDQWPAAPPDADRAWGIVPLDATAAELWAAVVALHAGLCVLPPELLASRSRGRVPTAQPIAFAEALSPRENDILQLLAEGLTNRQIAARTTISEHTVKFHLSSIFAKLGVASRTEAVRVGAQRGLVVW